MKIETLDDARLAISDLTETCQQLKRESAGNAHQSMVNAQAADNWRLESARVERQNAKLRRYVDFVERHADPETVRGARMEAEQITEQDIAETMPYDIGSL